MNEFTDSHLRIFEKNRITCRDVIHSYGDYTDGEIPVALKARLDAHIAGCECCQKFTATYNLTLSLASELQIQPTPIDVQNRLRDALNKRLGLTLPLIA